MVIEDTDIDLKASFEELKNSSITLDDKLLEQAEFLAEQAHHSKELELECDILTYAGRAYRLTNHAFKSINSLNKAYITLNSNFPHQKERLAEIYRELGNVYSNSLEDHLTSIEYQTKGFNLNVKHLNGVFLNNIGSNHMSMGEFEKAFDFFQKGISYSQEINNLVNLGYLNTNCGEIQIALNKPQESFQYFNKALNYCNSCYEQVSDKIELMSSYWLHAWTYHLMAQAYVDLNQFDKAKEIIAIGKAFAIDKKQDNPLAQIFLLEGALLIQENDLEAYEKSFNVSIKYCEEKGLLRSKHKWLVEMQKINEQNKDFEKAFNISKEITKNSNQIKAKHQEFNISQVLVSKEQEILALENKNRIMQLQKDELKQFAYIVTHDLKTPLSNISNFAGLFKRRFDDSIDDKGRGYLEYIIKSAGNLTSMLSALMQYISFENGEDAPYEDCDLSKVISTVLVDNGIQENQYSVNLNDLNSAPIRTFHLDIILENFIRNAKKFKKEDTTLFVDITVQKNTNEFLFSIGDNGIGIKDKYKSQIFEIFKRLNKNESSGTGIGLSICKKIVESYMGRLWVEDNIDSGCLFKFSIPEKKIIS